MDRPGPDYAAAMAFAQQQQAAAANVHPPPQQPQFGFHPPPPHQHQQYPAGGGHGSFLPPHPSHQQQFPYGRPPVQQPQYPHPPHMLHMQQQQQQQRPPPAFQQHIPPPLGPPPFHSPYDSSAPSPPPPPPPSDPELQKRIDKLVEYAAKNGPEFEAMIREKQKDNPDYAFLFGGDGYNYYRDKLWMATRPPPAGGHFNPPPYPAQSMPIMHPLNPIMGPNAPPQLGGSPNPAASSGMVGAPHLHQGPFPPFYEQNHPQHPMFGGHIRPDYDQTYRPFRGLSRPLPADVEMELNNVLTGLTGTKESIKGAKNWFMQRSPFIPALAEALRDRIFSLDDSERQLHIVYLANDILFDSLQRRVNPHELDNEALAFKPVLGSMLARIYHNPQNKEENQSRLQKIVQFWASKEVYDPNTIRAFENEMMGGMHMNPYPGGQRDLSSLSPDPSASAGLANQGANQTSWHLNKQQAAFPSLPEQEYQDKQVPPMQQPPLLPPHQFLPVSVPSSGFVGSAAMMLPSMQQPTNLAAPGSHTLPTSSVGGAGEKLPPYPLFPPGLIPGMVRKMQIGSGVPYSPMSPLDIPTVIPPSNVSPSEILERVSKFFKEIGEVNPSEGPMKPCESSGGGDDYDDYEREPSVRKGGACIPPPPNLLIDPESGGTHHPDERKPPGGSTSSDSGGGHRLGLGAASSANNPNEISQYDDVYSSYRKQRSTNYHTCMSARSAATTTTSIK